MSRRKNKQHTPPMRRGAGCMESHPQQEMIRIVLRDGVLVPDPERNLNGRGVYLCPKESCWELARRKRGFSRAFRQGIPDEAVQTLIEEIRGIREVKSGDSQQ